MRVEHLIAGKAVAGSSYFETVDPATQDVLAEVAAGTAADIDEAVAAAKAAFPAWAARPASEDHLGNASLAAATAACTSASPPEATSASTSCVAGLTLVK